MTETPQLMVAEFNGYTCAISGESFEGVLSPLSRAISQGIDIVSQLEDNPSLGDQTLAELVRETANEISHIEGNFNYIVAGAEPRFTTPMQYGGHFLELDRELIGARKPAITLIGGSETYIDIVSDLAESYLIWDSSSTSVDPQEVARMTRATTIPAVTNFPMIANGGAA